MVRRPFAGTGPRRRPGSRSGRGRRGRAGVRRPRGESCVAIRWVTAWGTTRGSRTVAPEWDIARFGEIDLAPWSRREGGRWARASSRRASRQASRQPRPARSKTGLGSGDESTIGSSWSSALAGEARASWCVRRAGFRRARAGKIFSRGLHTISRALPRQGDALRRCVPARTRKATRPLEEDFAENLLLVMGARKRVGGGQRCAGGGVSGSAIAPRKTYRLERLRYRGADVIARKTTRPTQSTVAHLETAARAASWGAAATKAAIAAVVTFTTSVCTGCWYAAGVGCELALVPLPPPTSAQSSADCSHGGL